MKENDEGKPYLAKRNNGMAVDIKGCTIRIRIDRSGGFPDGFLNYNARMETSGDIGVK